ncbi:hypothetical protein ACIRP4_15580 [Streptomyces bacillaris]|uniref:hypothetical protein n=1 Tax=Streptomyces bacillaris TaxID=68179 RepID=UPI00380FA558
MAEPETELFDAIRRDHRAGDRLPSSLAARHGVPRQTVMEAISAVLPLPHSLPADEEQLGEARQLLDALLAEDQAKEPAERRSAFELYEGCRPPQDASRPCWGRQLQPSSPCPAWAAA